MTPSDYSTIQQGTPPPPPPDASGSQIPIVTRELVCIRYIYIYILYSLVLTFVKAILYSLVFTFCV